MQRRFVVASALAVVVAAAFLPGSGLGSSAAAARGAQRGIPAGLAGAIHARLGAGAITSSRAARRSEEPPYFGFSVALSADGTTALVGAPAVDNEVGTAYVFHVSDAGAWSSSDTPTAALTHAPNSVEDLGFVVALSADGTTAFVGAPAAGTGQNRPGAIYVFHVSAEDAWASSSTPTATLTPAGSINVGLGKLAVSADGTTLVAGAPYYNDTGGGAYLFHVSSEGAWVSTSTPTATLTVAGESRADRYVGGAATISGDGTTVLLSDTENPDGGGAYVFRVAAEDGWTSSATWSARLSDPNIPADDYLGADLALSGDGTVALVDALGTADVFHASGAAAWASTSTPTATLTKAYVSFGDFFGTSVALSSDGTTALVTGADANRGAAFAFHVADEGAWASSSEPTATLTDAGVPTDFPHNFAEVGVLSADGATALAGASFVRFNTGAADVFHVADASSWASSSAPSAILTVASLARCVVPKLKGLTVTAAKSKLKERSCRLGRVSRVHAEGKRGRVVSQSRGRGSRLPVGTKVSVEIAK